MYKQTTSLVSNPKGIKKSESKRFGIHSHFDIYSSGERARTADLRVMNPVL